jgi:hypothetical protein
MEDVVEVFLWPLTSPVLYELQVSPLGVYRDLQVWQPGSGSDVFDDSWDCEGIQIETWHRYQRGMMKSWAACIGLPWSSFGVDFTKVSWRAGFFRIERDPEQFMSVTAGPEIPDNFHDARYLVPLDFRNIP